MDTIDQNVVPQTVENTSAKKWNWTPYLASPPPALPSDGPKPAAAPQTLHGVLRELFDRTGTDALVVGLMSWPAEDGEPLDPRVAEVVEELAPQLAAILKPDQIAKKVILAAFAALVEWREHALQHRDHCVATGQFGLAGLPTFQIAAIGKPLSMPFAIVVCAIAEETERILRAASSPAA